MADTLKQTALKLLDAYLAAEKTILDERGRYYSAEWFEEWAEYKRGEIERVAAEEDYRTNQMYTRIIDFNGTTWYACGQVLNDEQYTAMRAKETL